MNCKGEVRCDFVVVVNAFDRGLVARHLWSATSSAFWGYLEQRGYVKPASTRESTETDKVPAESQIDEEVCPLLPAA